MIRRTKTQQIDEIEQEMQHHAFSIFLILRDRTLDPVYRKWLTEAHFDLAYRFAHRENLVWTPQPPAPARMIGLSRSSLNREYVTNLIDNVNGPPAP